MHSLSGGLAVSAPSHSARLPAADLRISRYTRLLIFFPVILPSRPTHPPIDESSSKDLCILIISNVLSWRCSLCELGPFPQLQIFPDQPLRPLSRHSPYLRNHLPPLPHTSHRLLPTSKKTALGDFPRPLESLVAWRPPGAGTIAVMAVNSVS